MNKTVFTTLALLLTLASCTIEPETETFVSRTGSQVVTITASQEGEPQTKTVLDEDLAHVLWTPGDKINLFYQDQNACFEAINPEESSIAKFRGELTINVVTGGNEESELEKTYFMGLYPYDEFAQYDPASSSIVTSLSNEQIAANNSFADDLFISVGRSSSWNMPFYNVCSGLRFTVDQEGISSVILKSNDETPLAGSFSVGFDPETERPVILDVIDGYSQIRLSPPDGDYCFHPGIYYYIVTLPGKHENGITIELIGLPNPASVTTSSYVKFKRSTFLPTALTADKYYSDILPLEGIDLNIENEGVQKYLEEVDYSDDLDSYNTSYISYYTSKGSDKPYPVRFNWKNADSRSMIVTDTQTGEIVYDGLASETIEIYNLIPGRKYRYYVNGDVSWESTFRPKGPVRMINSSTRNFRDLGGWNAENGKTIVYGRLYRGAQISSSDEDLFKSLGITVDVDLRGQPGSPVAVFDQNEVEWVNFQVYQFMYKATGAGYTESLYREALAFVIDCLDQGKNVYFHCIGGADRTGTLAFLIEALLGVSEADMSKEYELTSFYDTRERNNTGTRHFKQLIFYLKTFEGETMQEKVTNWATTGENALTIDQIDLLKSIMLE